MVKELEKMILETFSLQIINEYDEVHGGFRASDIRPSAYMATITLDMTESAATAAIGSIYTPAIANISVGR